MYRWKVLKGLKGVTVRASFHSTGPAYLQSEL